MPIVRRDVESRCSSQRISQPIRRRFGAKPDYALFRMSRRCTSRLSISTKSCLSRSGTSARLSWQARRVCSRGPDCIDGVVWTGEEKRPLYALILDCENHRRCVPEPRLRVPRIVSHGIMCASTKESPTHTEPERDQLSCFTSSAQGSRRYDRRLPQVNGSAQF